MNKNKTRLFQLGAGVVAIIAVALFFIYGQEEPSLPKVYTHEIENWSMRYAESWEIGIIEDLGTGTAFYRKLDNQPIRRDNIAEALVILAGLPPVILKDFEEASKDQLARQHSEFRLLESSQEERDGRKTFFFDWVYSLEGVDMHTMRLFVMDLDKARSYVISTTAPDNAWSEFETTFKDMLASFKVTS